MDSQDNTILDAKLMVYTTEFHAKMRYDFTRIIFLGLRNETTRCLGEVLRMAATREGYEGHKIFSYKNEKSSHLYIRFRDYACAEEAIVFFRSMDRMFNADVVNNILLTWYMIEMELDSGTEFTKTCVDIESGADLNSLSAIEVQSAMHVSGFTCVVPNRPNQRTVVALFSSFALALGATIALGRWYRQDHVIEDSTKRFWVRIIGADKEARLFTICGSPPAEAFQMDYFKQQDEECSHYENDQFPDLANAAQKKVFTVNCSSKKGNAPQHKILNASAKQNTFRAAR